MDVEFETKELFANTFVSILHTSMHFDKRSLFGGLFELPVKPRLGL